MPFFALPIAIKASTVIKTIEVTYVAVTIAEAVEEVLDD